MALYKRKNSSLLICTFLLVLVSLPGIFVGVVAGENNPFARFFSPRQVSSSLKSSSSPTTTVTTTKTTTAPPPPPPPPSSSSKEDVQIKSRSLDLTVDTPSASQIVVKNILLRTLDDIQQSMEELVTGGYTTKEIFFVLLAIAAIGLACSAMVLEDGVLIDVLAWTCVIVAPSAAILQRKISLLEGMREITNKLKDEVNQITASNAVLQSQNRRLSKNTEKLKNTQAMLEELSASQGMSVDKLVDQVNEYKKIQQDIKTDLRSRVQQTLLNVFMRSDQDEDFILDEKETDRLISRLKSIPSIEFDEDRLRKALEKEGGDIMKFTDKYFSSSAPLGEERIFTY